MRKYDILAKYYHNSFNPQKAKSIMDELILRADEKGQNTFDENTVSLQIEDDQFINKLVLSKVMGYMREQYPLFNDIDVQILLRERNNLSATLEKESENEYLVFIDNNLYNVFIDMLFILMFWSIHSKDSEICDACYEHLCYTLDVLCLRKTPSKKMEKWQEDFVADICLFDEKITHLVCDVALAIQSFIIIHELAHMYLNHDKKDRFFEQEIEADKFAYKCLCDIIMEVQELIEQSKPVPEDTFCYPYTYLAPIIMFSLYKVIGDYNNLYDGDAPVRDTKALELRYDFLMDIPDEYDLDSYDGNTVGHAILNSIDDFMEKVQQH